MELAHAQKALLKKILDSGCREAFKVNAVGVLYLGVVCLAFFVALLIFGFDGAFLDGLEFLCVAF